MAYYTSGRFSDLWHYNQYSYYTIAGQEYQVNETTKHKDKPGCTQISTVLSSAPRFNVARSKEGYYENGTKIDKDTYDIAQNNLQAIPGVYWPHNSADVTTSKPTYSDFLEEITEYDRMQNEEAIISSWKSNVIQRGSSSRVPFVFNKEIHHLDLKTTYKVHGFRLLNIYKTVAHVAIKIAIVSVACLLIARNTN